MQIALTIAGSDSGGGAGIQADLKSFHQFGVFGTSVVVAITAQNTKGVFGVHTVPPELVDRQLEVLAQDLRPHAVKSGMLATAELVKVVAQGLRTHEFRNYVLDPVMVATSGDRLLDQDAEELIVTELLPLAAVVTPNLWEAEILTGLEIRSEDQMVEAGKILTDKGCPAALIKGGHLESDRLTDVLVKEGEVERFEHARIATTSTHGTGCTLSAAITAGLALGQDVSSAVERALGYVHHAMASAPDIGSGHGPLNHMAPVSDRKPAGPAEST